MVDGVHGYSDGERVFHRLWHEYGTVRVADGGAEVDWDRLEIPDLLLPALAAHLERVPE
jgi:hypothetical protein